MARKSKNVSRVLRINKDDRETSRLLNEGIEGAQRWLDRGVFPSNMVCADHFFRIVAKQLLSEEALSKDAVLVILSNDEMTKMIGEDKALVCVSHAIERIKHLLGTERFTEDTAD